MTQEISDKLLAKIRALLRMAEHENSNPFEASLAMEKAQALLLEHNLSRGQIFTDANSQATYDDSIGVVDIQEGQAIQWKARLAHSIAKSNLCKVIMSSRDKKFHLFGTETNVRVVLEMYYWVGEQLERMAGAGFKAYKADQGTETKTRWSNSFYVGALETLRQRLQKPFETFSAGTGRELVVVNDKALATASAKLFPNSIIKGSSWRPNGRDGIEAGKQAGRSVSFSRPGSIAAPRALGSGR